MSDYEALSLVAACLALCISLVTVHAQRKLQREANDLQRATAELSRKQLELIERSEREGQVARVSLSLKSASPGYRLLVRNLGPADAHEIEVSCPASQLESTLVSTQEVRDKCPIARLRASETASLMASLYLASPPTFNVTVRWKNSQGTQFEEDYVVAQP
jgi:hypothetical protein